MRQAAELFAPRRPIAKSEHLAGRKQQIAKAIGAIVERGAHAIIYGERGVGKTSLANCLSDIVGSALAGDNGTIFVVPAINSATSDTYSELWKKVFSKIQLTKETELVGITPRIDEETTTLAETTPDHLSPFDVQNALEQCSTHASLVVIINEVDRLEAEPTKLLADTIKALSDHDVNATVVVVGVGDSVMDLIRGHESIGRHLVEVSMPRMSVPELEKIIVSRMPKLGLNIDDRAVRVIIALSRGLPFYVHLLAKKAALLAISGDKMDVTKADVSTAMSSAIDDSERALKESYYTATLNPQSNNRYPVTLAACALAECDEFGYFAPKDVAGPLEMLVGEAKDTPWYNDRLKKLATEERGNVLNTIGTTYNIRYRFREPLMQPFVVIKSVLDGLFSPDAIL